MKYLNPILLCILVLAAGAAIVGALFVFKKEPVQVKPAIAPRFVTSMVVRSESKRIDVKTQGTVKPRTEINLVAQVPGEAMTISNSLENGGFFAKDEVLVQLDDRDYKHEVTRANAQVAQTKVRVSLEEAEAEVARAEWESLGKGKATPLTLREPQVLEAKAALAAAKAGLEKAKLALARTTIRAPFAGRVRTKHVDAGQFVTMGAMLARVYAVDYAEVRLPLHDSKLRYLDLPLSFAAEPNSRTAALVTLHARFAQQLQKWNATIVRTEGEVDPKSRMVHAIARVIDPYGRSGGGERPPLSVGMFVEAEIRGKTFEGVFEIPRDAVHDDKSVLVIDKELRMHRRPIRLLHRGDKTVIVEDGLRDGERICLSPVAVFAENMRVQLVEPDNAATDGNGGDGDK